MAGTDLVRAGATTIEVWREYAQIAESIANTDFVPKAFRNNPAAVTAAMLTGHELGLPPMQSLAKIFIINGRPGLYAEAMRALVQSNGHEIWPDDEMYTTTRVRMFGKRNGTSKVVKVEWNMDMAKAAGLASKDTWRGYPRSMLVARCTGELCRLLFADVLGGVSYTVEELEDGFADGEPLEDGVSGEPPKAITRKAAAARKTAAAKAAPAPAAQSEPPLPPLPGEEDGVSGGAGSPAPAGTPRVDEGDVLARAQSIAIACGRAGLDDDGRHRLIAAVTNGRVSSAKEVTAEEGADVLAALHEIGAGRRALVEGDDGWVLIVVEDATGDGPPASSASNGEPDLFSQVGDEDQWATDQWRAFLKARGVKVTELLRRAHELAKESGVSAPASLEALRGQSSLCSLLRGWVEDEFEKRGGA